MKGHLLRSGVLIQSRKNNFLYYSNYWQKSMTPVKLEAKVSKCNSPFQFLKPPELQRYASPYTCMEDNYPAIQTRFLLECQLLGMPRSKKLFQCNSNAIFSWHGDGLIDGKKISKDFTQFKCSAHLYITLVLRTKRQTAQEILQSQNSLCKNSSAPIWKSRLCCCVCPHAFSEQYLPKLLA